MDKKMIKNTDEAVETVDVVASETADAENGVKTISLGKRILRCETAAVSAVTLTMYTMGEME